MFDLVNTSSNTKSTDKNYRLKNRDGCSFSLVIRLIFNTIYFVRIEIVRYHYRRTIKE